MMSGGRGGQKVLSRPSADSFAVGRRQKGSCIELKKWSVFLPFSAVQILGKQSKSVHTQAIYPLFKFRETLIDNQFPVKTKKNQM
jgi:hypothetical protein